MTTSKKRKLLLCASAALRENKALMISRQTIINALNTLQIINQLNNPCKDQLHHA